ncbi:MAG TPA: hypothetical protein VGL46_00765, partial [Pseudonocardiaceae bacterium]
MSGRPLVFAVAVACSRVGAVFDRCHQPQCGAGVVFPVRGVAGMATPAVLVRFVPGAEALEEFYPVRAGRQFLNNPIEHLRRGLGRLGGFAGLVGGGLHCLAFPGISRSPAATPRSVRGWSAW